MCREYADEVLVRQDDVVEGMEHLPSEGQRVVLAEEIRPSDGADEQRPAREEEQRLGRAVRVGHGIGDVLRRMARRLEDREPQGTYVEALAVTNGPVVVGQLRPGADNVARAGQRGQLPAAGDVIVVEVRLDDVADPDVRGAGGIEVDVDVAARVDDRRQAGRLVGDKRREVAEAIDDELAEQHRGERTSARSVAAGVVQPKAPSEHRSEQAQTPVSEERRRQRADGPPMRRSRRP